MTKLEIIEKMAIIIPEIINTDNPRRIKRGILHTTVSTLLNIPNSPENIRLMKAVLAASGVRSIKAVGYMYYTSHKARYCMGRGRPKLNKR